MLAALHVLLAFAFVERGFAFVTIYAPIGIAQWLGVPAGLLTRPVGGWINPPSAAGWVLAIGCWLAFYALVAWAVVRLWSMRGR